MQTITFSQLLLLLLTHKVDPWPINKDVHPLPPTCSFSKLPHSYGFWGCTRPTGGVCGLKRNIICDSSNSRPSAVLEKTPPTTPTKTPSVPSTSLQRAPSGHEMKERPVVRGEVQSSGQVMIIRRVLASNLVLSLLCSTGYWLPLCQSLPSQALQMVKKMTARGSWWSWSLTRRACRSD